MVRCVVSSFTEKNPFDLPDLITGISHCPRLSFKRHPAFRKLEISLGKHANAESAAAWLSETLSTITSSVFTELSISIFAYCAPTEDQIRGWNSVDNVLGQARLFEGVILAARPQHSVVEGKFKGLIETYFPLMWGDERVVLEGPPPDADEELLRKTRGRVNSWLA